MALIKDSVFVASRKTHKVPVYSQKSLPVWVGRCVSGAERGCYQEDLLEGFRNWSGADLQGKARDYSAHYSQSRVTLLRRIQRRLRRTGWEADVPLVLNRSNRWERQLLIQSEGGRIFEW